MLTALVAANAYTQRYPILPVTGSPPNVSALMQDSRSALWLGTQDDVYCFDGNTFYSLRQYGFPAEKPIALAEDSEHGIWIATEGSSPAPVPAVGGLYRYRNGRVEKLYSGRVMGLVNAGPNTMLASAFDATRTFTNNKDTTAYRDLYIFREAQDHWQGTKVLGSAARQLTVDHQGSVLFPCPSGWCGLSRADLLAWPRSALHPAFTPYSGSDPLFRILRDRFNCLWFRDRNRAAYQCPGQPLTLVPDSIASLDSVARLDEANDGSILLVGPGLAMGRPGAMHVLPNLYGGQGFGPIVAAADGTLFIGNSEGLFRFMYPFRLEYWEPSDGFAPAYFVSRVGEQTLASNAGIEVLSADRSRWSPWARKEDVGTVVHMLAGPQNSLYAASHDRGVIQLGSDGHVLAQSPAGGRGLRLASDAHGHTWLAGTGVKLVSRQRKQLVLQSQGLDNGISLDLQYDPKHSALWACHDSAVAVLENGGWTEISARDGLLDDQCRSLALLPNDEVWVGYASAKAISRINRASSGKFQVDTFPLNGPSEKTYTTFLNADHRGWIWRGSDGNDFLATVAAAQHGEWLRLDAQDGIPSPGGNQNSFSTENDGSVWFANDNYVTHFKPPDDFATRFPPPRVFVSGFTVGANAAALAEGMQPVAHGAPLIAHVGSLQFDRRNGLQLRYRLLPNQTEWTQTDKFDVILGKLAPGTYTLEAQGRLMTGDWSPIERTSFRVLWPVWLSWPSLLLTGAGVTVIALGISQSRKSAKQRAEGQLPDLSTWRMEALSPEAEHLIGTVIDRRYEIGHILSLGAFATVARARDLRRNGQLCAIKIYRYEPGDRDWIRHRFEQEVTALEQLSHPNIIHITGHGTVDTGAPYLVMEFVHGYSLRELLEKGPLPHSLIAVFLRQLASALALLHGRSIYHRDLKPENLVTRSGTDDEQQIVLIDFSIAIVKSPERTFHGISRVAGTLGYMAPEQVIGYADASTDIHALAKVVVEMLTGSRWTELLPEGTLDMPEFLRSYLAKSPCGLGSESVSALASALAFDPARRPKDVLVFTGTLLRDLDKTSEPFA